MPFSYLGSFLIDSDSVGGIWPCSRFQCAGNCPMFVSPWDSSVVYTPLLHHECEVYAPSPSSEDIRWRAGYPTTLRMYRTDLDSASPPSPYSAMPENILAYEPRLDHSCMGFGAFQEGDRIWVAYAGSAGGLTIRAYRIDSSGDDEWEDPVYVGGAVTFDRLTLFRDPATGKFYLLMQVDYMDHQKVYMRVFDPQTQQVSHSFPDYIGDPRTRQMNSGFGSTLNAALIDLRSGKRTLHLFYSRYIQTIGSHTWVGEGHASYHLDLGTYSAQDFGADSFFRILVGTTSTSPSLKPHFIPLYGHGAFGRFGNTIVRTHHVPCNLYEEDDPSETYTNNLFFAAAGEAVHYDPDQGMSDTPGWTGGAAETFWYPETNYGQYRMYSMNAWPLFFSASGNMCLVTPSSDDQIWCFYTSGACTSIVATRFSNGSWSPPQTVVSSHASGLGVNGGIYTDLYGMHHSSGEILLHVLELPVREFKNPDKQPDFAAKYERYHRIFRFSYA